jgi:hypothetical protein
LDGWEHNTDDQKTRHDHIKCRPQAKLFMRTAQKFSDEELDFHVLDEDLEGYAKQNNISHVNGFAYSGAD